MAVTQGIFFYSYEATKAFAVKKLARNLTSLDGLVVGTFAGTDGRDMMLCGWICVWYGCRECFDTAMLL